LLRRYLWVSKIISINFPPTSPNRKSLVNIALEYADIDSVGNYFKLSTVTVRKARREEDDFIQSMKSRPNLKRKRLFESDADVIQEFLDEEIPVISGRSFRVQSITDEELYARYFGYCCNHNLWPVCRATFTFHFLKKERIHHNRDDAMCKYCAKLAGKTGDDLDEEELQELESHKERWYAQGAAYLLEKERIVKGEDPDEILVLQDFTQLQVQSTFYQDLIIVFYSHKEGGLSTKYFHFVGETAQKNDIGFVISAWKTLIKEGHLAKKSKITIYSDGGPKHFKITACMSFFADLQKVLGIPIFYNFFESNHGHSVCDAAAAHAKKLLNTTQRDTGRPLNTAGDVAKILDKMEKAIAQVADGNVATGKFATFKGIRSFHKFTFGPSTVTAYGIGPLKLKWKSWILFDYKFFDESEYPKTD